MRLKAIIFDLDGTLADTLPVCFQAIRNTLLEFTGRTYTDRQIMGLFGPSEKGICQRLIPGDRWEECFQMLVDEYERHHFLCTEPFPGVADMLDALRRQGVKLGIVTGKSRDTADISFRRTGLDSLVDAAEAGSEEGSIKPQMIRKLLQEWGIPPDEAAYVGDAPADIEDAREAGVIPLAAAWLPTADYDELSASDPAAVFRSVEEMMCWLKEQTRAME